MNWNRSGLLLMVLLCMAAPAVLNAVSEAALTYLLIEPGARPGGMGRAFVAQSDDAFANYWNPGALAFSRGTQVAGMHTNWFGDVGGIDDIYLEFLGWNQYYQDIGTIGAHIIYMSYGDQDRTDEDNNIIGSFSSWDACLAVSYANQIRPNIGIGATFKFLYSNLAPGETGETNVGQNTDGMSWAFDLGLKARDVLPRLDFGLNIQNLGMDITYVNKDQADPLPLNWRMGISYRAFGSEENTPTTPNNPANRTARTTIASTSRLTINADMNKLLARQGRNPVSSLFSSWTDDNFSQELRETIFTTGAEYVYLNLISLRGGYYYDKAGKMTGPCFGLGISYKFTSGTKLCADYAMVEGGDLTDYNKLFSITVDF